MAAFVILNSKLFYDEYDISGLTNQITLAYTADLPEANTLGGSGTRSRVRGLIDVTADIEGFVDASEVDEALYDGVGRTQQGIFSVGADPAEEGGRAYFIKTQQGSFNTGGAIGEVAPFSANLSASGQPLVRGVIGAVGDKDSNGNSTVFNLGALPAGIELFASLHAVKVTEDAIPNPDPTLDVIVQSSAVQAFTGPTDRITFTEITDTPSSEFLVVRGAVTDEYWRVRWEVDDAEYDIFVAIGILA